MAKRRTSGIQRRSRASDDALGRRLGASTRPILDWRLLALGAILVLGAVILLVVLMFGGGGSPADSSVGERQADAGGSHIAEGSQGNGYTSVPATSGPHWSSANSPGPWGIYANAQPQERFLHNMEHGGMVIWYQPSMVGADGVSALTTFVQTQISTERFKVILSPWSGADFGRPIAVVSWGWLLYLDTADLDMIRSFIDDHYGDAPEPAGGPGRPAT